MIRFKFDILPALKAAGYNCARLRREHILAECVIQKIRHGEAHLIHVGTVGVLCRLLGCQPGDILEYVPDADEPPQEAADDALLDALKQEYAKK